MINKSPYVYMEDILNSMNKIIQYTNNIDFLEFSKNEMIIDAVVRNLEIIGEASKYIPDDIREKHESIPWSRMIGLRNILIHQYFGIDIEIVWEIITKNIPEALPLIKNLISDL